MENEGKGLGLQRSYFPPKARAREVIGASDVGYAIIGFNLLWPMGSFNVQILS